MQIGTGHVMRCLTLANELSGKGVICTFVCREHKGHLIEMIREHGFEATGLPDDPGFESPCVSKSDDDFPAHYSWLGAEYPADAEQTKKAIRSAKVDWLIVDHYGLDSRWENAMRDSCVRLMVIDDLADRKHDCDLLLDQNYFNFGGDRYHGLIPPHCLRLLGPEYALLREEFSKVLNSLRHRDGFVRRLLIFFGGTDPDNLTGKAIQALNCSELDKLVVDVVIGLSNPYRQKLCEQIRKRPLTQLHVQTQQMAKLLNAADLVVGAGGTNTWERLVLGVPSIIVTIGNNQEEFSQDLHEISALTLLGKSSEVTTSQIRDAICLSLNSKSRNKAQSGVGKNLVNSQGSKVVVEIMLSTTLEVTEIGIQ